MFSGAFLGVVLAALQQHLKIIRHDDLVLGVAFMNLIVGSVSGLLSAIGISVWRIRSERPRLVIALPVLLVVFAGAGLIVGRQTLLPTMQTVVLAVITGTLPLLFAAIACRGSGSVEERSV